jgi:hypothetical protein
MQKADKALEGVDELRGNLAYLTELLAKLPDNSGPLAEKLADLEALVVAQQELGATPLAIAKDGELTQRVAVLEESKADVEHVTAVVNDMDQLRQGVKNELEALRPLFNRVHQLEEWQAAALDEDDADDEGRMQDAVNRALANFTADRGGIEYQPRSGSAPHVLQLIVQLKKAVGAIGKDRQASHTGGRYAFRGVDDAMNAVGNACNAIGIVPPRASVISSETTRHVTGDRIWTSTTCVMRYTFQSPVDGSEWSTEGIGEGRDLADKSAPKAQAAALKYALFHGLAIPIEGMNMDAEAEHPVMDGRPADQGSHEYRQWELAAERQERAEYERHAAGLRRDAEQATRQAAPMDGEGVPDHDGAADERRAQQQQQQQGSRFGSKLEAAQYCLEAATKAPSLAALNQVVTYAQQWDLMEVQLNGSPLAFHLIAIGKTKPPVTS